MPKSTFVPQGHPLHAEARTRGVEFVAALRKVQESFADRPFKDKNQAAESRLVAGLMILAEVEGLGAGHIAEAMGIAIAGIEAQLPADLRASLMLLFEGGRRIGATSAADSENLPRANG